MKNTYQTLLDTLKSIPGVMSLSHILYNDFDDMKSGWNGLLITLRINQNDGLFFITRCLDNRYFQHGNKWRLELSVGDSLNNETFSLYDNSIERPIIYSIFRPILPEDTEKTLLLECEDLIDNMCLHFNDNVFMSMFNLDRSGFKPSRLDYTKEAWERKVKLERLGIGYDS